MMRIDQPVEVAPGAGGIEVTWTFRPRNNGRKSKDDPSGKTPDVEPGNIPRVSRLMALAIKFDSLVRRGEIRDYADLARLGYVTRARITQIMNLLNLAPDIQEEILFLERVDGLEPVTERGLREVVKRQVWAEQENAWSRLNAGR